MVSLDISDYAGFDLLQKFERHWSDIHEDATLTADVMKKLETVMSSAKKTCTKINSSYNQFCASLELFSYITKGLDRLAGDMGKLQSEFLELEKVLSFLESVCDEQEQVEKILHTSEEVHALKITKQKELEELKATLAKDHATFLERLQKDRMERKQSTEKAIQSAIWNENPTQHD